MLLCSFCPLTKGIPKGVFFAVSKSEAVAVGSASLVFRGVRVRAVGLLRTTNLGSWMCQMTPHHSSLPRSLSPSLPPSLPSLFCLSARLARGEQLPRPGSRAASLGNLPLWKAIPNQGLL